MTVLTGTTQTMPSNGITFTAPVLQPGCGMLTFGVDCCHVDHYLAIQATKVRATPRGPTERDHRRCRSPMRIQHARAPDRLGGAVES